MYPPTISEFAFNIFLGIKVKLSGCNSLFQRAFFFKIDAVCLQSPVAACAGSNQDEVNYLHSSCCGSVFQICDQSNTHNKTIQINTNILGIAEQGLHSIKTSSVSHFAPPVSMMKVA